MPSNPSTNQLLHFSTSFLFVAVVVVVVVVQRSHMFILSLSIGSITTMNTTELQLYNASKAGDVSKVKAVLTATPTVDVNKQNPNDVRDDCVMQTAVVVTWCVVV
jgi:hypothetical protein